MRNEKGVTLVEMIVVLALISMIAAIIMTTFFIVTKYNITETKNLKLQQEANYIVTKVLQEHRAIKDVKSCYTLNVVDNSGTPVDDTDPAKPAGEKIIFTSFKVCDDPLTEIKEVVIADTFYYGLLNSKNTVTPRSGNFKTTITVLDPENTKLKVALDTEFSRYRN